MVCLSQKRFVFCQEKNTPVVLVNFLQIPENYDGNCGPKAGLCITHSPEYMLHT